MCAVGARRRGGFGLRGEPRAQCLDKCGKRSGRRKRHGVQGKTLRPFTLRHPCSRRSRVSSRVSANLDRRTTPAANQGRVVRSGGMSRGSTPFAHDASPVVRSADRSLPVRSNVTLGYCAHQRASCREAPDDAFLILDPAQSLLGFMPANFGRPGCERCQDSSGARMPAVTEAARRVNHPLRVDHADYGKVRFVLRDRVGPVVGVEGKGGYVTLNRLIRSGSTVTSVPAHGGFHTKLPYTAEHQTDRAAVPDRFGIFCGPFGASSAAGDSRISVNSLRTVAKVVTG